MPGEAGELTCARCGREVRVNRDSFEVFERMHYVCFHYEFEHGGFDPDEECDARVPVLPARRAVCRAKTRAYAPTWRFAFARPYRCRKPLCCAKTRS